MKPTRALSMFGVSLLVACSGTGGGDTSSSSSSSGGAASSSTGSGGTSQAGGSSGGGPSSSRAGSSGGAGSSAVGSSAVGSSVGGQSSSRPASSAGGSSSASSSSAGSSSAGGSSSLGSGGGSSGAPVGCNAYTFSGTTYNCGALDRCTNTDFTYALACCSCDSALCEPCPGSSSSSGGSSGVVNPSAETCMRCHNGASTDDYSGNGIENPHPWIQVRCTGCHGGNGQAADKNDAHVPPPTTIGDNAYQRLNPHAYFNRLTLQGMDKQPDYPDTRTGASGTLTGVDYLQFVNPGDLRVVKEGRACGACHAGHASWAKGSPIATAVGMFSNSAYSIGLENFFVDRRGDFFDTLADYAWREWVDNTYQAGSSSPGQVASTREMYEIGQYAGVVRDSPDYTAAQLADDQYDPALFPARTGRVQENTALGKLFMEQISITCGDCHAGAAGANNRYGDYRSSGCTACHMSYALDGRSRSRDSNLNRQEPLSPDVTNAALAERPHVETHQMRNVARLLPNGAFVRGVADTACVGCHQGSNRTVLQYWGIRLDQNGDLFNNQQYPANPNTFATTAEDERLFDPTVNNQTFNGRNSNQYIQTEDYDADYRDDTPPDIHYERGMGCIDCHGSRDLHGGTEGDPTSGKIHSRMDQVVKIRCENCHGNTNSSAPTTTCTNYTGQTQDCARDDNNNPIRHVYKDVTGAYWLVSRLTGERHYIPQTRDAVSRNNKRHPVTQQLIFNPKASYAMGRVDADPSNGAGPIQADPNLASNGFSHTDNMDCTSCHASWNNQCVGCHLRTAYDANPSNYFFSNITGERILLKQHNADFTYISPVPMYLGVNSKGKVTQMNGGMKVFYAFTDQANNASQVFTFSDRAGNGNNPSYAGRNAHPALGMSQMSAHTTRGKVTATNEGPRYCVACHMNQYGLNTFGAAYADYATTYFNRDYANMFNNHGATLQQHIGLNTGNQLNSPFWVHMVAGLGTGLYLFGTDPADDTVACPVNPFDANDNRFFCQGTSPQDRFNNNGLNLVLWDLDRYVEWNPNTFVGSVSNATGLNPMLNPTGSLLRAGSLNPNHTGPLGSAMINKIANTSNAQGGRVLDSWLDANGNAQGSLNLNALP